MDRLWIVPHHQPRVSDEEAARAIDLARQMLREEPRAAAGELLRDLLLERWQSALALHLEDVSSVALLDRFFDVRFVEDRARLRADGVI